MIERKFIDENIKEFRIQEHITDSLGDAGLSRIKLQKTALGERILVYTSRPGLVVGRKGENIKRLTRELKKRFNLENPQIEIEEVQQPYLDANLVAERIKSTLERFGSKRFKGIGHQMTNNVMGAGALGVEVLISGKIPSARARTWRFYQGYLKKCGDVAVSDVDIAYANAKTKMGTIGIKVSIMPPGIRLPDSVLMLEPGVEELQDVLPKEKLKEMKAETKTSADSTEEAENASEPAPAEAEPVAEKEPAKEAPAAKEAEETGKPEKEETPAPKEEQTTGENTPKEAPAAEPGAESEKTKGTEDTQ